MKRLSLDYSNVIDFLPEESWADSEKRVRKGFETLHQRNGKGSDYLGWMDLPGTMAAEVMSVESAAEVVRAEADILVVIGIGGSYLGARAVIDSCRPCISSGSPEILYAGHHLSGPYLSDLVRHLNGKSVFINVISKSGTTTEPALAFRVLKHWMEAGVGKKLAAERIIATTDATRGALRSLADTEGYRTFIIPDDVGGRFSVLSPVGLLPAAVSGLDIGELLSGAAIMQERIEEPGVDNPAFVYALVRDAMYRLGKGVEVLAAFDPRLLYVTEWWKQLFGESEGKDGRGIFPASVVDTTDLHSMGQYIQDGVRNIFETFITVGEPSVDVLVPESTDNLDGLNYLSGKSFSEINRNAHIATALAHRIGGVPNMTVALPDITPGVIGQLLYMFETAVALSGYALGINPFDQPGVEEYKRNMFALLKKPGFEAEHTAIRQLTPESGQHIVE